RRARGTPWDAERVGITALAIGVIVFALHSGLDWSWFVPGNAVVALLCAGWVVAQPPLLTRLGAEPREAPVATISWPAVAGASAVVLVAVIAAWGALQPVRSMHAEDAAFSRLDEGQVPQAAAIAQIAHERDPLATEPLYDIATIAEAQGDHKKAA